MELALTQTNVRIFLKALLICSQNSDSIKFESPNLTSTTVAARSRELRIGTIDAIEEVCVCFRFQQEFFQRISVRSEVERACAGFALLIGGREMIRAIRGISPNRVESAVVLLEHSGATVRIYWKTGLVSSRFVPSRTTIAPHLDLSGPCIGDNELRHVIASFSSVYLIKLLNLVPQSSLHPSVKITRPSGPQKGIFHITNQGEDISEKSAITEMVLTQMELNRSRSYFTDSLSVGSSVSLPLVPLRGMTSLLQDEFMHSVGRVDIGVTQSNVFKEPTLALGIRIGSENTGSAVEAPMVGCIISRRLPSSTLSEFFLSSRSNCQHDSLDVREDIVPSRMTPRRIDEDELFSRVFDEIESSIALANTAPLASIPFIAQSSGVFSQQSIGTAFQLSSTRLGEWEREIPVTPTPASNAEIDFDDLWVV